MPAERRRPAPRPRSAAGLCGALLLGVIALAGALVPLASPYDPGATDLASALLPPGPAHWLGTDQFGRDLLTRMLYAIRVDLPIVLLGTASALALGVLLGCLAGYCGGWPDALISRAIDVLVAFPHLVLVLAAIALAGPGAGSVVLVNVSLGWVTYARLARAQVLVARRQPYVEAARALGFSHLRIICRHILPNGAAPVLVFAMADLVQNLHLLVALSFFGLGAQPPTPEWGAMIAEGRPFLLDAWGLSTWPGLAVVLAGLGFSLLGEGLRNWLDPRRRR